MAVAPLSAILTAAASLALRLMSSLASGLYDSLGLSSLAVPEVLSLSTVHCIGTALGSDEELDLLLERLDLLLEELHSLGEIFLATVAWALSRGVTVASDFDEELD